MWYEKIRHVLVRDLNPCLIILWRNYTLQKQGRKGKGLAKERYNQMIHDFIQSRFFDSRLSFYKVYLGLLISLNDYCRMHALVETAAGDLYFRRIFIRLIPWKYILSNGADFSNKMKIWTLNLYKSCAMSVHNYYITFGEKKTAVEAATKCKPRWDPAFKR